MTQSVTHDQLAARLAGVNQSHVYAFYSQLAPDRQAALDAQVASLDWPLIDSLVSTIVRHPHPFTLPASIAPAPYYPNKPKDPATAAKLRAAFDHGQALLREGKVASFVVAGGQGSRLGWDGPKGTFPGTPIKKKPLFQCFAEFLLALGRRAGKPVPFYIMTSPQNHAATVDFWTKHNHFGMNKNDVVFFPQDSLPAIGYDGKVLLESKDSLALSPNGHGGSLLALHKSGALADMARRGVTQISYFQVDNPIVRCVDPTFIGLHDLDGAQMSSKMLPKVAPKEKLGNLCLADGKVTIIEYSDLPDALAEQRLPNGDLALRSGSIALHALRRDFVEQLNAHGFALPYHRAEKKIPCIDLGTGQPLKPEKPNAIKLETFVFDALPLADTSIIYETDRIDEFAPIKNAEGVDSAVSARAITLQRNAQWLEAAGVSVPRKADGTPDCVIEIAPSFAIYPADVAAKKSQIAAIKAGDERYFD